MTYATGLGQFNIAVSSSDAVRRFLASQRYGTFGTKATTAPVAPAPSPWPTVTRTTAFVPRTTTTTFKPVISTMPVLKSAAPTLKPVVPTTSFAPTQQVSGGASPTVADETALMSPSKSPLPLILAGLAALFLLNRKGR